MSYKIFRRIDERLGTIAKRLAVTGDIEDLQTFAAITTYDERLEAGVKKFQARHGLEGQWGLNTLEISLSRVCDTRSFRFFACKLLADLPRFVQIHNESDVDYELEGGGDFEALTAPKALVLRAGKTVLLQVRGTSKEREGRQSFRIPYSVTNLKTTPDATLSVELEIDVTFEPDPD